MKKIISLICVVAIAIACFVPVTYAAAKPTMNVDVQQITDFTGDYASYATVAGKGFDVYLLTFTGTGLSLSMAEDMFDYSGTSIIGATVQFNVVSDGEWKKAWSTKKHYAITPPSVDTVEGTVYTGAMAGTSYLYPVGENRTVTAADETPALYQLAFYLKQGNSATLTFQNCAINVGTFNDGDAEGSTTYKMSDNTLDMSQATVVLPLVSTYTYTFKNIDGTADIEVQADLAAGATVTAPTAPTVAGKVFDHWSDAVGGAAVDVDATASDNKTYFAVYVDAAPAYETVAPSTAQTAKVAEPGATTYTDYDNKPVTLSKNYAIARFQTGIDGSKKYEIHASSASTATEKDFDVDFGLLEVSGTANFVTIIKGAPADTVMELRVK